MKKQLGTALVSIFLLFVILFHYPMLAVFNHTGTAGHLPVLVWGVFALWMLMILALYLVLEKGNKKP